MDPESILINELRDNARVNLSKVSRKYNIPIAVIYYVLDGLQRTKIRKHVCILDFESLKFKREIIILKGRVPDIDFLNSFQFINNSYRTNRGILLECIFSNKRQKAFFLKCIKAQSINYDCHPVLEVLDAEKFKVY